MKVIFLDIDGVLVTPDTVYRVGVTSRTPRAGRILD